MHVGNGHPALRAWWHPVAHADELSDGQVVGVQLLGEFFAVFRSANGLGALVDRCPHRRASLSRGTIVGESLQCAYHGWRFGADGSCQGVPGASSTLDLARLSATPIGIREEAGLVWLAVEEPASSPPILAGSDTSVEVRLPIYRTRANAAAMIENFLDVAHFPFVHAESFGGSKLSAERIASVGDYEIQRNAHSLVATGSHACTDECPPQIGSDCRQIFTYRYQVPFAASVSLEHSATGARSTSLLLLQPESGEYIRVFYSVAFNQIAASAVDIEEVRKFEEQIMHEDMTVQEAIREPELCLRGTNEASTRLDRLTLTFRKVLATALFEER